MKITQIMLGKAFGGAERSFVDLSQALAERGHSVLAIGERRGRALDELASASSVSKTAITVLGAWDRFATWRIRHHLAAFEPDIVQLHLARAATLGGRAARALGIPTLCKTHNYVNLKYYRYIDRLVPTTISQRDYLIDQGVSTNRIAVIPNFSRIAPGAPIETEHRRLEIVAIGRFVHKKGFDVLLRALGALQKQNVEFRCTILGDGPEMQNLLSMSEQQQLDRAVRFCGWQDDVQPFLAAGDVFVLPSRDEPFGIVCLEAMALGIPIIATRTAGPSEILNDETALMIEPNSVDSIAHALMKINEDRSGASKRAALARDVFNARYSEKAVVDQYELLYQSLLGS